MARAGLGWLTAGWLCLAACAGESPDALAARTDSIYGGRPAPDDRGVFFLSSGCTATLIASRTLLTAAHCVDDGVAWASNGASMLDGPQWRVQRAASYSGVRGDWTPDLGLVLLEASPGVPPLRWQATGPLPPSGTWVRHVGYGLTEQQTSGERRTVSLPITGTAEPAEFGVSIITGGGGVSICMGDSGGPAFVGDAGQEAVLAVHSFTTRCGAASGSALVFPYRRFIESWLAENEQPSCARDTRCVPGCAPVDLDCVCGPDGQCGGVCPDGDDPDCPPSCRADGVCAPLSQCPVDLDCLPLGARCLRETQCGGRLCAADPQNATRYCTVACDAGVGCPTGFECGPSAACIKAQRQKLPDGASCQPADLCADGYTCFGGVAGHCTKACRSAFDCLGATQCDYRVGVCVPAAPVTLDAGAQWTGQLARLDGCAAGGGAALAWLGALLLGARRRRR